MVRAVTKYRVYAISFVIYLLFALARFPHIALNITSTIPGANGDAYQNLWGMWWVVHSLFYLHTGIYHTNLLFWPIGANLIYETMSPLGSIITAPFQLASLPLAYNVLFFIGFPLSALGMFVLADYITSNKSAAFVSGLVYSFSAMHIIQAYSRIDWMVIGWIPFGMYFLMKIIKEERSYPNTVWFSLSFVFGILIGDLEQGLLAIMLYFAVFAAYAIYPKTRRQALRKDVFLQILASIAIISLLGSFMFVPVIISFFPNQAPQINSSLINVVNQLNSVPFNIANSLDVFSFFLPSFYHGFIPDSLFLKYYWRVYSIASVEKTGYLTFTALALAIVGAVAYRKNDSTKLWLALMLIFGVLSLGPYLTVAGNPTHMPLPYLAYHDIPLLNIIREPNRFIDIFLVPFSILAALGYKTVDNALDGRKYRNTKPLLLFALVLLFLVETSGVPITNSSSITPFTTTPKIPEFYYEISNLTGNFSVMQLPPIPSNKGLKNLYVGEADYYSTASGKPILGGYITRTNYSEYAYLYSVPLAIEAANLQDSGNFTYISPVNENYTNQTLLALYNFGTAFVVINRDAYTSYETTYLDSEMTNLFGNPVFVDNSTIAFATSNAIKNSLFRSFVTYPIFSDWEYLQATYSGTNSSLWMPVNNGMLAVYAPYGDSTGQGYQYVNATLRFMAVASIPTTQQLDIQEQSGINNPIDIASLNITPTGNEYTIRLNGLTPGDIGNDVMFISNGYVLVWNITITKD